MFTPTTVSNAILQVGSYIVTIGPHQWDFVDGAQFYGATLSGGYGVEEYQPYDVSESRTREVRFVRALADMEQLRELGYRAGLNATKVKFTPDAASPGTFWWIDWPDVMQMTFVADNRYEMRVKLLEQAAGA